MKQTNELRHIAIEGVIGAGKTTLARMLSERLQAKLILEQFEENPFLEKFYHDASRYGFQTQIFFLLSRYKQQQELFQTHLFHNILVTDYLFEKDKIFAYLNLSEDELKLYETLVNSIEKNIPTPDLVVYLQSNVERLLGNIQKRGRTYETKITKQYLQNLNEAYNHFFFRYKTTPLLIVNAAEIDFVHNEDDFEKLFREILRPTKSAIEYYNPSKNKPL